MVLGIAGFPTFNYIGYTTGNFESSFRGPAKQSAFYLA
jgi:hypothetical protein